LSHELVAPVPAWGDREFARFEFRVGLFKRRGLSTGDAEALADRLARRDYQLDDRRACIECEHIQRNGGCFIGWQQRKAREERGTKAEFHMPTTVMPTVLQRCPHFNFQRP
jgi:hypothetical protein